jgi:hypothetical protein
MYRKPRASESASILNLDSLMDILSCLVGVMLFLVIYTVLELGATSFEVSVPTPKDRPIDSRRILVVVNDKTVRVMDAAQPVSDLLNSVSGVSFERIPELVQQANMSPPTDAHFQYQLAFEEEATVFDALAREFNVNVSALAGEPGDSLHQLVGDSSYEVQLDSLDGSIIWLEFAVDSASVEVFRRARDLAEARGIATRWGPLDLNFPITYSLAEDRDGPSPRSTLSKPQR